MTKELMAAVKERLETAEIPYQYETYQTAGKLPPVYCVGHCSSSPVTEESGVMSGTFLLTLVGTSWDAFAGRFQESPDIARPVIIMRCCCSTTAPRRFRAMMHE